MYAHPSNRSSFLKVLSGVSVIAFLALLPHCASPGDSPVFLGTSEAPYVSDDLASSGSSFQISPQAVVSDDFQTVTVYGRVQGPTSGSEDGYAALGSVLSPVRLVIRKLGIAGEEVESRVVETGGGGSFSATFDVGSDATERFEIKREGTDDSPVSLEIDVTGAWEGSFSLTGRTGDCGEVPQVDRLAVPVSVDQQGKLFEVDMGSPLNINDLLASVGPGGVVSGEGEIALGREIATRIGCYSLVTYRFSGTVGQEEEEMRFDVTFEVTLSDGLVGCRQITDEVCVLTGRMTGTRL